MTLDEVEEVVGSGVLGQLEGEHLSTGQSQSEMDGVGYLGEDGEGLADEGSPLLGGHFFLLLGLLLSLLQFDLLLFLFLGDEMHVVLFFLLLANSAVFLDLALVDFGSWIDSLAEHVVLAVVVTHDALDLSLEGGRVADLKLIELHLPDCFDPALPAIIPEHHHAILALLQIAQQTLHEGEVAEVEFAHIHAQIHEVLVEHLHERSALIQIGRVLQRDLLVLVGGAGEGDAVESHHLFALPHLLEGFADLLAESHVHFGPDYGSQCGLEFELLLLDWFVHQLPLRILAHIPLLPRFFLLLDDVGLPVLHLAPLLRRPTDEPRSHDLDICRLASVGGSRVVVAGGVEERGVWDVEVGVELHGYGGLGGEGSTARSKPLLRRRLKAWGTGIPSMSLSWWTD